MVQSFRLGSQRGPAEVRPPRCDRRYLRYVDNVLTSAICYVCISGTPIAIVVVAATDQDIVAAAPVQRVVPITAIQDVVARATVQGVIASTAEQNVAANPSVQDIVARVIKTYGDVVVSTAAVESVTPIRVSCAVNVKPAPK